MFRTSRSTEVNTSHNAFMWRLLTSYLFIDSISFFTFSFSDVLNGMNSKHFKWMMNPKLEYILSTKLNEYRTFLCTECKAPNNANSIIYAKTTLLTEPQCSVCSTKHRWFQLKSLERSLEQDLEKGVELQRQNKTKEALEYHEKLLQKYQNVCSHSQTSIFSFILRCFWIEFRCELWWQIVSFLSLSHSYS
jgi:hypothetical protein